MTGIIILAAGASTRFGSPKQLALFNGKPLLRHAVETAMEADLGPVTVVLGAVDPPCRHLLAGTNVQIVHNPDWRDGMSSSIKAGLRPWLGSALDGVVILLGDQPRVAARHLRVLEAASPRYAIVATRYHGKLGVPAWFSWETFPELMNLEGEKGAQGVIVQEPRTHFVDLPAAGLDVDIPADLMEPTRRPRGFSPPTTINRSPSYA